VTVCTRPPHELHKKENGTKKPAASLDKGSEEEKRMGMEEIIRKASQIDDPRQAWKISHTLADILLIVLLGTTAGADGWEEITLFATQNVVLYKKYLSLPNGIPSSDTIARVMGMLETRILEGLYLAWNEYVNTDDGEKLKKLLNVDGKTSRGNGNKNQVPLHTVSAWCDADGVSLGQRSVGSKENEITAIPDLLKNIRIAGHIVTIDAMGTQKDIAALIRRKQADYVLAVKGNHPNLMEDIKTYFNDEQFLRELKEKGCYTCTKEKHRGQIETREYYQSNDIAWLYGRKDWKGLASIGMTMNTINRDGEITRERRYFISSLPVDIQEFARAVRGHWSVESMHWHLDVTFREDHSTILDKQAAANMNIIRKWSLSILRLLDIGKKVGLKAKRKVIGWNPYLFLEKIFAL
jgi:predicted transposase YbfD/YdcC